MRRNEKSVINVNENGIEVNLNAINKLDKKGGLMKNCGKVRNFQFKNFYGPDIKTD